MNRAREAAAAVLDIVFLLAVLMLVVRSEGRESLSSVGTSLLLAGLAYGVTAFLYRRPVPVQPLKVLALSCLIFHPKPEAVDLSALAMGISLFLLGVSGVVTRVQVVLTPARKERFRKLVELYVRLIFVVAAVGILLPVLISSFPDFLIRWQSVTGSLRFHGGPVWLDALILTLPQLPVTVVNGLILTVEESRHRVEATGPVSFGERTLAVSLGIVNIVAALLSAFPVCHGSGAYRYYRRLEVSSLFAPVLSGVVLAVSGGILCLVHVTDPIPGPLFGIAVLGGLSLVQRVLGGAGEGIGGYLRVLAGLAPGFFGAIGVPVLGGLALLLLLPLLAGMLVPHKNSSGVGIAASDVGSLPLRSGGRVDVRSGLFPGLLDHERRKILPDRAVDGHSLRLSDARVRSGGIRLGIAVFVLFLIVFRMFPGGPHGGLPHEPSFGIGTVASFRGHPAVALFLGGTRATLGTIVLKGSSIPFRFFPDHARFPGAFSLALQRAFLVHPAVLPLVRESSLPSFSPTRAP